VGQVLQSSRSASSCARPRAGHLRLRLQHKLKTWMAGTSPAMTK
jgi:hypothetical protein